MSVSAFPLVVDALVALAGPLVPAGVTVVDGMPTGSDPSDFLAVGVPSLLDVTGSLFSGESRQSWASVGALSRDEEAFVNCVAAARSQDETVKDARDRAYAIVEAVAGLCRSNPTLGVPQLLWTSHGVATNPALLYEEKQPVAVVVEFQVAFRARI